MKVLWLASWYPNPSNPFDGDFVQRHAKAVAGYVPVTILYVSQAGIHNGNNKDEIIERINEGVNERIIFFKFKKTGIGILDKVVYNWLYYKKYKQIIKEYFNKTGKPDIVHVHIPIKAGMIAKWINKKWNIPYIVSEQSAHYAKSSADSFLKRNFLHRSKTKKVFKHAKAVTNVSGTIGKVMEKLFALQDVRTIHNTVDSSLFNYSNSIPDPKFKFIHVSTLKEHQKNSSGILETTAKLTRQRNDFELVIVGPASEQFKRKAMSLGLATVIKFTGEIPYTEVAKQMQEAAVLILFSRYENFPCVIVEALCCGLPVISSDVGGIKEAINASNGMLLTPGSEEELARAMNRIIDDYKKFDRNKIASTAIEKFGYAAIGKQFFELYKEILKQIDLNGFKVVLYH